MGIGDTHGDHAILRTSYTDTLFFWFLTDELIDALARAADQYEARDLRVQIETTIVEDAVALPLSIQPVVAISDRSIEGVDPRPGGVASLTSGVADWTVADG